MDAIDAYLTIYARFSEFHTQLAPVLCFDGNPVNVFTFYTYLVVEMEIWIHRLKRGLHHDHLTVTYLTLVSEANKLYSLLERLPG